VTPVALPTAAGGPARWKVALAGVAAVISFVLLCSLGVWQLERRVWKLDLIERVEQRVRAAPVAAPGHEDAALFSTADEYRHVRVSGRFLHRHETLVQAVTEYGTGYWLMTPLRTDSGLIVLINRGFVPPDKRDAASRPAGQVEGNVVIAGLMRLPEGNAGFLRHNDPVADRWYARDVNAIGAARGLVEVAPYFIDADGTPNPGGWPIGGLTVVHFSNNHLIYALTWFVLALMLAVGLLFAMAAEHGLRAPHARTNLPREI
jgi:surfeit locus 1 family protein